MLTVKLYRARLPSLYSDFSLQRHTNPDGYASNVSAWQRALAKAARAGCIPSSILGSHSDGQQNKEGGGGHKNSLLVLKTGDGLVRELESAEWGRPVALGCVVVCPMSGIDYISCCEGQISV